MDTSLVSHFKDCMIDSSQWSNKSPAEITGAFSTLVDQMRASKPTMKILVSIACDAPIVALEVQCAD
jgi:hypothetical protein